MKAIEDAGVYRYFVPKRYGGYEFSLTSFMDIGLILGEACISTGWVTTFCMEHNWLLALYGQAAQDDIFGRQPYIIAPGALAPKGTATPVEGGYRVTGRWEWGTSVMHSDWVMRDGRSPGAAVNDSYLYRMPMHVQIPNSSVFCGSVSPRQQVAVDSSAAAAAPSNGSSSVTRHVITP